MVILYAKNAMVAINKQKKPHNKILKLNKSLK